MLDFRGNEIIVGDTVIYAPTNRYSGLVEATVLEVVEVEPRWRSSIKVQPVRESHWNLSPCDRSAGRTVRLTNLHRVVRIGLADPD